MPVPGEQQHPPTDAELIARVRAGDRRAYGPLYERHRRAALRVARHLARDEAAAEDLTSEAFTRVLAALDRGNGPDEAFRAYLYTTLRRTAFDWAESDKRVRLVENVAELEVTAAPVSGEDRDPLDEAFDRQITSRAFHSLPERWQIVLWHLEVEGETPAQVAPLLDLSPPAVSALAYRAREGLRQAFLQEHLAETVNDRCRPYARRLAAFVRGKLGTREQAKVERHLDTCADCTGLYLELLKFNESLPEVLSPLVFGSAAAAKIIAGVMTTGAGTTATIVGGGAAGGAAGGTAAGAAADGTAKAGGLLARWLMQARKSRTQAITMAAVAALACAILAWGMSGGGKGAPLDMPASSASSAAALPAPNPVTAPAAPKPPAPTPKPTSAPIAPPPPVRYTPIAKPSRPPKPVPTPTPTPTQSLPVPAPTPTTPPPPPPPPSTPSPTPAPTPSSPPEETICELAWQALQDPTPENIGLILAGQWDPDCVPVPWVPIHWHNAEPHSKNWQHDEGWASTHG